MTTPEDILAFWFPAGLALGLAIDGLERGHYAQLATVWEKTFFLLPLGHSEQIALLERCVCFAKRWSTRRQSICGRSMRFRHPRRAAIATSSPASVAIPIATPCLAGRRPRMSERTSHPVSSFIGARFKGDGTFLEYLAADPER